MRYWGKELRLPPCLYIAEKRKRLRGFGKRVESSVNALCLIGFSNYLNFDDT